jgi:glutamyl-tRNA synthetase
MVPSTDDTSRDHWSLRLPANGELHAASLIVSYVGNAQIAWPVDITVSLSRDVSLPELQNANFITGDYEVSLELARILHMDGSMRALLGWTPVIESLVKACMDETRSTIKELARTGSLAGAALEAYLAALDERFVLRSFLVDYEPTVADLYLFARLRNRRGLTAGQRAKLEQQAGNPKGHLMDLVEAELCVLPADTLGKARTKFVHLARWMNFMENQPFIASALERAADALSQTVGGWDQVMRLVGAAASFDIQLPDAQFGRVVTRFPPEPSGYLHIGHAKALLLNDYFARIYGGELILRFDDTNPSKEKMEYEESILADCAALDVRPDRIEWTSDYFDVLLEWCEKFIRDGNAYVDRTEVAVMREQRLHCIESAYRNQSVEENLRLWKAMKEGLPEASGCCVRAKIDMQSKNASLRDPVIYRIAGAPADAQTGAGTAVSHHRTGTRYRVYPSYDFACPIVDSLEGVTHALRTSEYQDREAQYIWMCQAAGLRCPRVWTYSRLSFVYTVLSKRKLTWLVDHGYVDGWDDPRMPTVRGILRRGMHVNALRAFILSQGPSRNITFQQWDKIWTTNKRVIDPIAPRHTAIARHEHWAATLTGLESLPDWHQRADSEPLLRSVPRHKKNPELGTKVLVLGTSIILEPDDAESLTIGEIVTLMDLGNARVEEVDRPARRLSLRFMPEDRDFKKTKKLTWLTMDPELVLAELVRYGYVLNKEKLEEGDELATYAVPNEVSKRITPVWADINTRLLSVGSVIQFERRGYYRCDQMWLREGDVMQFIEIPDGRTEQPQVQQRNGLGN